MLGFPSTPTTMHLDLKNATVDGKILHELILVGVDVETLQFNTGYWYQPLKVFFSWNCRPLCLFFWPLEFSSSSIPTSKSLVMRNSSWRQLSDLSLTLLLRLMESLAELPKRTTSPFLFAEENLEDVDPSGLVANILVCPFTISGEKSYLKQCQIAVFVVSRHGFVPFRPKQRNQTCEDVHAFPCCTNAAFRKLLWLGFPTIHLDTFPLGFLESFWWKGLEFLGIPLFWIQNHQPKRSKFTTNGRMTYRTYTPEKKKTCPLKRDDFSWEYIFQPLIFRGHVSFQGCKSSLWWRSPLIFGPPGAVRKWQHISTGGGSCRMSADAKG